jgi:formylglycine-generating enzyme required for sulfatase activity/serine/threonine protein kinase
MASDPLNLVGTMIADKYAVESVVGEGGFAIVYRAQHLLWKRPVAVKVFNALAQVREEQREKLMQEFIREGALLAELSERSAAIVQARDIGMLKTPRGLDVPYMVLEWLEGSTLESVLANEREGGMPRRTAEQAVKLLDAAAEALALAHARGIAHRDVKPSNVFVLGDPRADNASVKLLDFGIAKVVQDAQSTSGEFAKTAGHITAFTPSYGAPEQFNRVHGATGPWTDVFALALVVVEVLSGREPFQGNDLVQLAFASLNPNDRPTPRNRGANVSDDVERVLARAVSVATKDRYPDAREFWNALRAAVSMAPMRSSAIPSPLGSTGSAAVSTRELESAPTVFNPTDAGAATEVAPPAFTPVPPKQPRAAMVGAVLLLLLVLLLAGAAGAFYALRRPVAPPNPIASVAATAVPPPSAAPDASSCPEGMVLIPAGEFFMGSDRRDAKPEERPPHKVHLSSYCIDAYEVTVARYVKCTETGACLAQADYNVWVGISEDDRKVYDPLCNLRDRAGRASHPMNCVDWARADDFCRETGARLPTEAEWEYAALGPAGWTYPWGMDEPSAQLLNACGSECVAWGKSHKLRLGAMYQEDDRFPNTAPVGMFPKGRTQRGLYDMVGNVWEWTADWFGPYGAGSETDPRGPGSGERRVARGGAWNSEDPSWVRPTYRFAYDPAMRSMGIGFRCARSLGR